MTYQVLARKWRPQSFAELIGQEPIVTALRNALSERRIAQAYLFSGIRGVGKTTAARLLAKALNCEQGPTPEPCNRCVACVEITRGSDLDVIEVDAATYSKVEQVRELTESLKYGPARDRYKVVVLDEIHRLSRQAFDALLKIVEEPPPHLVFVFATTESEAVPATVLSRCQEFHFRRVPAARLAAYLRTICEAESIEAGDAALRLIARAGEGSVRDAVALLDQLATFGSGSISDEDAARLTGGLDNAFLAAALEAMLGGRGEEIRRLVARVEDEGWDPRHAFNQILAWCRDALHLALAGGAGGGGAEWVDLPEEEATALAATARAAGYENLLRLLGQLLASEQTVRRSEAGALALEIALLRAAELPKLVRVEEILAGGGAALSDGGDGVERREAAGRSAAPAGDRATAAPEPRRAAPAARRPEPPPPAGAPDDDEGPGAEGPAGGRSQPAGGRSQPAGGHSQPAGSASRPAGSSSQPAGSAGDWRRALLDEVGRRRQPLAAHLSEAERLVYEDGRLSIHAPPGDPWLDRALRREGSRKALDEAVAAVWGTAARWELVEGTGEPVAEAGGEDEPPARGNGEAAAEVADDPAVQTMLELFQGRVEAVEETTATSGPAGEDRPE
jgi:DNA polymerase-3 subunit gamma/tau